MVHKSIKLSDSIEFLKGVGPKSKSNYERLGLDTVKGLLMHVPVRYEDYSKADSIADLSEPGKYVLKVRFDDVKGRYARRGLHITTATAVDDSGAVRAVWYNQPYRAAQLAQGEYYLNGAYSYDGKRYSFVSPSVFRTQDIESADSLILPIYKKTKGITDHTLRQQMGSVRNLLTEIPDTVPASLHSDGLKLSEALDIIHFPKTIDELMRAQRKLTVDEMFVAMLGARLLKDAARSRTGIEVPADIALLKKGIESLSFKLTDSQKLVLWEILKDMESGVPMNRLLQGDVGAGKTVVAQLAALHAVFAGKQVVYVAPTEILARQQYHGFNVLDLFKDTQVELLIGSSETEQRKKVAAMLASKKSGIVVATHAIFQDKVTFGNVALVVVDEQHRFGVKQRGSLAQKQEIMPHILTMTATPIPRSLALTYFGDLEISSITQLPVGRIPIETEVVSPVSKKQVYKKVDALIDKGHQAYVVAPSIEESDKSTRTALSTILAELKKLFSKDRTIGVLHGKLPSDEKKDVMERFLAGSIDILLSTTVIEVGVHNDNAVAMVIEGAEFYGLAQLHQLRGRVGRGSDQSYCYLIPSGQNKSYDRLDALESTTDGMKLAELDLKLRGPGQIYGSLQSGEVDMSYNALNDIHLIQDVNRLVEEFVANDAVENHPSLLQATGRYNHLTLLN